jgi:hypothetical protein
MSAEFLDRRAWCFAVVELRQSLLNKRAWNAYIGNSVAAYILHGLETHQFSSQITFPFYIQRLGLS